MSTEKDKQLKEALFELTKSKKTITLLKNVAVKGQDYELSARLREIELSLIPEKRRNSKEMKEASLMQRCLGLTNLKVSMEQAYIISAVSKVLAKKGDSVDVKVLSKIESEADEIFN